ATSCRDDLRTGSGRNDGRIAFTVNSGNDWQTRAATDSTAIETYHIQQKVMPIIVGNDTLMLTLTIEPNFGIDAPAPAETRSAPVTTATLTGFHTVAYCQDNSQLFFNEEYPWTDHSKPVETGHFWPNNRQLAFCAYALQEINNTYGCTPADDNQFFGTIATSYDSANNQLIGNFNYTSPCNNHDNGEWWRDAFVQPDPIIAITENKEKTTTNENVSLTFHHALAAVRFRLGDIPEDIWIQDLILRNVFKSGKCDFKLIDDNVNFEWSGQNNKGTYVQEIITGYSMSDTSSSDPLNLYCKDSNDTGTAEYDESTFFIVPQKFEGENAGATIELKTSLRNSKNYKETEKDFAYGEDAESGIIYVTKKLAELLPEGLKADTRYTFTLSVAGSMGISVTDDCSSTVKDNVKITNTGKSTGWVRAAIVGWWKNTAGNIVAPWNDLPSETCTYGTYELPTNWPTYWGKGSDGFFYYRRTLLPGKQTDVDLFTSYTLTGSAPVTGAVLEIDIVAQIIRK
ncbi:MAG: hypothetical protein ACI31D_03965, partial [Candidatus Limisoma sp.]